jgi:putative tryptophan/tyrosine transport system substrate-binding protein
MRRRDFIAGLGAAAWPVSAQAQQPALPIIGYLGTISNPNDRDMLSNAPAFRKGLSETGYVEGQNVAIEYRWTEAQNDRLPAFVSDLVGRRVAVIAAMASTAAALAAKAATQTIPIVFRIGGDPVANGLVASLNRPGGNVTGVTTLGNDLGQKRLELLRELLPAGAAVALLANPTNANAAMETKEIQTAAHLIGLRLLILHARTPSDIEAAFVSVARPDIGGLLTTADTLFFKERDRLVALAARQALPAIYSDRFFYEGGGLMSYGTNSTDGYRIAGVYAGRILRGEKPADLPVQQATRTELVINLKTAKGLGLTIPETLLATADEVIQ